MQQTSNMSEWIAFDSGETFNFDAAAAARLSIRSFGNSAVYVTEVTDPGSGEVASLETALLVGSGSGEYEVRLTNRAPVTLLLVLESDQYPGAFKPWAGTTSQPEQEPDDPFTVIKPRTVLSEEMRAMQMMLLEHRSWVERQVTAQQLATRTAPEDLRHDDRNPAPSARVPDGAQHVSLVPEGAPLEPAPGRTSVSGPAVLDTEPPSGVAGA